MFELFRYHNLRTDSLRQSSAHQEPVFPSVPNTLLFTTIIIFDHSVPPSSRPDMTNYSYYPTPEAPAAAPAPPKLIGQLPTKTASDAQFWFSVFECTDTTKVRRLSQSHISNH